MVILLTRVGVGVTMEGVDAYARARVLEPLCKLWAGLNRGLEGAANVKGANPSVAKDVERLGNDCEGVLCAAK